MGIDPGVAKVGFGLVRKIQNPKSKIQNRLRYLDYGLIKTDPSWPPEKRLRKIYLEMLRLIREWKPKALAVESVYFFKNLKTALPVSQARGVILLAAAQKKVPVYEITPLQAKIAITGYGRAEKKQVQRMVKILLDLKEIPKPDDIADALSIAICCSLLLGKKSLTGLFEKL